jgi:hypothetical protein
MGHDYFKQKDCCPNGGNWSYIGAIYHVYETVLIVSREDCVSEMIGRGGREKEKKR